METATEELRRTQNKKLREMQMPTSEQIKKQVSVQVDNQLHQKVCESALKKNFPQRKTKKGRERVRHMRSLKLQTEQTLSVKLCTKQF